jgi:hypothetical protein
MKSILDPKFRYTSSVDTDLRRTFARVRREREREQRQHDKETARITSINRGKEKQA